MVSRAWNHAVAPTHDTRCASPELVSRARAAQGAWANTPLSDRLAVLRKLRHAMAAHAAPLAKTIASPNRSASQALVSEVLPLADAIRFLERSASRILRPVRHGRRGRPAWLMGVRLCTVREPLGVVLIISPRNYPLFLPGVQAVGALAAGNAAVVKCAPGSGAPMYFLRELAIASGLNADLLGVCDGQASDANAAIDAGVDKVVLTASAATGRSVLGRLARSLTPAVMELSGCDASFILDGADLGLAADALAYGMTFNGGATCIAPRRCFVPMSAMALLQRQLLDRLAGAPAATVSRQTFEQLKTLIAEARQRGAHIEGNSIFDREGNDMGSPARGSAWEAVGRAHLDDAGLSTSAMAGDACASTPDLARASISQRPGDESDDPCFIDPVVVTDVTADMRIFTADIFAPVLMLIPVNDVEKALRLNALCPYALGASIFGPAPRARALAHRVNAGTVVINDLIVPTADPRLSFGGRGQSGFGATRGAQGLLEMTRVKSIVVRGGAFRPHFAPPLIGDLELFESYLMAAHGHSPWRRLRAGAATLLRLARRKSPAPRAVSDLQQKVGS